MKTTTLSVLAIVALVHSGPAAHAQNPEAEVRTAIQRHYDGINNNDLESVGEQHLPEMSWFPGSGEMLLAPGTLDRLDQDVAMMEFTTPSLSIREFNAQVYGDVAIATFYLVGRPGTDSPRTTNRVSAVWVRQGSEWKEAHHHESPLVPGEHP